jgi:hypothetical protein
MKYFIYLVFLQAIFCQNFSNFSFTGAKSMGMAGAVVSNIDDSESIFYNPSGLVLSDNYSVILGTTMLYDLNFLKHQFLSISFPNQVAISFQQLSTDSKGMFSNGGSSISNLSNEQLISFSQGFNLLNDANSTLSIGYNINALVFNQTGSAGPSGDGTDGLPSSKSSTLGIDIGIHSSLRNKISFGAFMKNINNPTIKKGSSQSHFPRRMDIGITYKPFNSLHTTFAFERLLGESKTSFRFGTEYAVTNNFTLRSGIQMNPNRLGLGLSYNINNIELSYALLTHSILSNSNVITIKVDFE